MIPMDREGDVSRPSPTRHLNYPGLNSQFDGRNKDKTRENINGFGVAKDATKRRRHRREFPMTSIFGGGFPVVFPPKITDFKSENRHYITIDYD